MKYSQAEQGRTFIIRLEDGEILHSSIEAFAMENNITAAALIVLGGADKNSKLVVGPEHGRSETITPMHQVLKNVHEITGTGTLFPNEDGKPTLHMHISCGRGDKVKAGCVREGVRVWQVMEVILFELTNSSARRRMDGGTGFELLSP
jgi:predicted DNA-binding protein with PD1-like motif